MSKKKTVILLVVILFLSIPLILKFVNNKSSNHFTTFDNLSGPSTQSFIEAQNASNIKDYEVGPRSRMAILITDTNSKWLDLIKGLKSIGISLTVTTDYKRAIEHKVILVYPYISGAVLSVDALKALIDHPMKGGTLLAVNVLGGGLQETFGFGKINEGQNHKGINFSDTFTNLITPAGRVVDDNEKFIPLSKNKDSILITNSYELAKLPPLATYENGEVAITQNTPGSGHAYALGIDLGQLFYIGYSNREEDIARTYVNNYGPVIDVFLRFIKETYLAHEPLAVVAGSTPAGKDLSIILSHDVDFASSVKNSLLYSELEKSNNISATYFLQVKYLKDFNDKIFFNDETIKDINQIKNQGMEIGSHSISHSRQFAQFPIGDGLEHYPDYKPFVIDRLNTRDGSILGELRVSKFLIESKTLENNVVSFRPGELSNPYSLPQALKATGFKYSSSVTANNSLTHLPFQLSYNRESTVALPVYEFPVTIEDEEFPNMMNQLPLALKVSEAISHYQGLFVVLIHPNVTGHKLEFEKKIIEYWKDRAWFGNMATFGDWWAKRDNLSIDIENKTLTIVCKEGIRDLALNFSSKLKFETSTNVELKGKFLLVKECNGSLTIPLL